MSYLAGECGYSDIHIENLYSDRMGFFDIVPQLITKLPYIQHTDRKKDTAKLDMAQNGKTSVSGPDGRLRTQIGRINLFRKEYERMAIVGHREFGSEAKRPFSALKN